MSTKKFFELVNMADQQPVLPNRYVVKYYGMQAAEIWWPEDTSWPHVHSWYRQVDEPEPVDTSAVKMEKLVEFASFAQWVSQGSSLLSRLDDRREVIICVDAKGFTCYIGEDFMRSRDEERFPVTAYRLMRSIKN